MSFIIFLLIFSWWTRYVQVWIWRLLLVHKLLFTTRELWFILLDPICKTYFYILIALVLKADILDCYIPRSFFFSIPDFKWMFWITKVFVCSSCLNFWHYTHTSIFLNLFTNFNQTRHKTSQGEGKSKLLNWRINNMHTYKNYSATILKIHASLFWVDSICSNHHDSNQT